MTIKAWHFSDGTQCRYDHREIVAGETLTVKGPPLGTPLGTRLSQNKIVDSPRWSAPRPRSED